MKLSIIIPAFNEESTIQEVLKRVSVVPLNLEKEIIVVDDYSQDATAARVEEFVPTVKLIRHERNYGKGHAIKTGLEQGTGDFYIIQDADLEYDPADYKPLIDLLMKGESQVVYGSRFLHTTKPRGVFGFWQYIGNRVLTHWSNIWSNTYLTDMETCYKAFTAAVAKCIVPHLHSERFGFEPEFTALVSKIRGCTISEVGVSYKGRSYKEGKKISWKDGAKALVEIPYYTIRAARKMKDTTL